MLKISLAVFICLWSFLSAFPIQTNEFKNFEQIKISDFFDCYEINFNGSKVLRGDYKKLEVMIIVDIHDFDSKSNSGYLCAYVVKGNEVCKSNGFSSSPSDTETGGAIAQFNFENTNIILAVSINETPLYNFAYWAVES